MNYGFVELQSDRENWRVIKLYDCEAPKTLRTRKLSWKNKLREVGIKVEDRIMESQSCTIIKL